MGRINANAIKIYRVWRWAVYGSLIALSCAVCFLLSPGHATDSPAAVGSASPVVAQITLEEGQQHYQAGDLAGAVQILEQVAETSRHPAEVILTQRNLALIYRELGQWTAAETAIAAAQAILETHELPNEPLLLAQLLDVQGGLQFDQGQGKTAITTWQQSIDLYTTLERPTAAAEAHINQAHAMQQLGFHLQAIATLQPIVSDLALQADTLTEAVALHTLADSLLQAGNLPEAEAALQDSLAIAQAFPDPATVSAVYLSLGNLKAATRDTEAALAFYQRAESAGAPISIQVQSQLNQLNLLAKDHQTESVRTHWSRILETLDAMPPNQTTLFAKINLAQSLIQLPIVDDPSPRQIADILVTTIQQARELGDRRAESFATGTLGYLYETLEQWPEASDLSQSALTLAQEINATDITYRWQWQLGRIYKAEKQTNRAISAYSHAVSTLKRLRTDLVAVNPAVQFSFQENVEPIHRELVALLLDPERAVTPTDLEIARNTIESLQLAELDNFFREACLDAVAVNIDQLDQRAAVVYPVILGDRLEIILSLPDHPLKHATTVISSTELNQTIEQLQQFLVLRVGRQYLPYAQQLYDWVIRPIADDLSAGEVDTLVFVLDGELRNIPMSVLHDGNQFLLERYSVALTPGLQLVNPNPLQDKTLRVLTAGLSESRQGFSALPNVVEEVNQIQSTVPTAAVLLNDSFTVKALSNSLALEGAPIVHLATHGQFSSANEETFVLTWNDRLNIDTLNNLLQISELNQNASIELLVLSACETATGDQQAALGMAGMAVRSGARSTIATLWQVNDEATAQLMTELYNQLAEQQTTKAEALRKAQLAVLQNPRYRQHPYYWSSYILVGNWL